MSVGEPTRLLLDELPVSRPLRVLDVGANPLTPPPYADLLAAGGCRLTGFEPQWDAYTALRDAAGPDETYHNAAVGSGGERTLHITRQSGFTSLFRPDERSFDLLDAFTNAAQVIEERTIETTALDDIDGMEPQDVLKIDVQGAELEIFASGPRTLERAVAVVSEVRFFPLYAGEPEFADVDRAYRDAGFRLLNFQGMAMRRIASSKSGGMRRRWSRSQAIDCDAIYIRDLRRTEVMSDDELCHLTLAADAILGARDVAAHCLDTLVSRHAVPSTLPDRYMDLISNGEPPTAAG